MWTGLRKIGCIAMGTLWTVSASAGVQVTLEDRNSVASVVVAGSAADGMTAWAVDGCNQLTQQWFWYRVGPTGREIPLGDLSCIWQATNSNWEPGLDTVVLRFCDVPFDWSRGQPVPGPGATLEVDVTYVLRGGATGTGASGIAESITVTNLSGSLLDLHFFQYSDFDLAGSPTDDAAEILAGVAASQRGTGPAGTMVSETAVTANGGLRPTRWEAGLKANLLGKLTDADADDLGNVAGPVGPGDLAWAFQWDVGLTAGGVGSTLSISKDKSIGHVPEPGTLAMLAAAGAGLTVRRKRP